MCAETITFYTDLNQAIRDIFGEGTAVRERIPVSGGDINRAYVLLLSDGEQVFMKANSVRNRDFFRAEATFLP